MKIDVAPELISLSMGEAHVWIASAVNLAPETLATLEVALGSAERIQSSRFRFLPDRTRYVFAHGMLREVLSRYVDKQPNQLTFDVNDFGKPSLTNAGPEGPIEFNMSHSESLVVVAVASGRCIGVDAEFVRPIEDIDALAQHHFTTREQALLRAAPADRKERVFYSCWTRKEAFVKAVGMGLSIPLDSFESSRASDTYGGWLQITNDSLAVESWWLSDLALPEGYVGALVIEGRVPQLTYVNWSANGASVPRFKLFLGSR